MRARRPCRWEIPRLNRRSERTAVTTALRPFAIDGAPVAASPALTVRPGAFMLDAGAAITVAIELDFASCPELVANPLQTSIDIVMNDSVAIKVWLEVEVYEAPS